MILSLLAIAMAVFVFVHFVFIEIYGEIRVHEPNQLIAGLELAMAASILFYCVVCYSRYFRSRSGK